MSKKKQRGLSLEQKREKMLQILQSRKEVFKLKELEKIGSKAGVTRQSIKDVLQSLVDDNLIFHEKLGIGTYYWSFPAYAYSSRKARLDELLEKRNSLAAEVERLKAENSSLGSGREGTEARDELDEKYDAIVEEVERLEEKVKVFGSMNPEHIKDLQEGVKVAEEAVERWTDAIFEIKDYVKKKLFLDDKKVVEALGIEGIDYID